LILIPISFRYYGSASNSLDLEEETEKRRRERRRRRRKKSRRKSRRRKERTKWLNLVIEHL
jgi:hypothetical protein